VRVDLYLYVCILQVAIVLGGIGLGRLVVETFYLYACSYMYSYLCMSGVRSVISG